VEEISDRIKDFLRGRDEFIHALDAMNTAGPSFTLTAGIGRPVRHPSLPGPVPVNPAGHKKRHRSMNDLEAVRDEAARISCALAHLCAALYWTKT
jgi:hypothetical protein